MSQQPSKPDHSSALKRAGITSPYQLLLWLPKRYKDFTLIVDGNNYSEYLDSKVCIELTLTGKPTFKDRGQFTAHACDSAGNPHRLMLFGMLRFSPWANLDQGDKVWVRAKVVEINGRTYLNNVELIPHGSVGAIVPVYAGKPGVISSELITSSIREAMADDQAIGDAALSIREAFGGMEEGEIMRLAGRHGSLHTLIATLHAPSSREAALWAIKTAKAIAVAYIRWAAEKSGERPLLMKSVIRIPTENIRRLLAGLPYQLTRGRGSQISAIKEIIDELAKPYPMDALLSADVGTGKTVCYGVVAAAAQELGHRVAILIPNTVLVNQVAKEIRSFFPGLTVVDLGEKTPEKEIPWEKNPVIVGTTRIFGVADRARWRPDLLIVDEQQKTDENQRSRLRDTHTNFLEATATPIPRVMAQIAHGGKRLIQVSAQHAEKHIRTTIVQNDQKREMFGRISSRVKNGEQVVIIYPRVSAKDENAKSVIEASQVWERHFPGKVAFLHGKMRDDEKVAVMDEVTRGEKPILVSSSIIEIGVNIPDLRLVMVVHAERYGVFTLHQIRGRLARHGGEGECILYLPDEVNEESMERLRLLEKASDGFTLAELDMQARGFGNLAEADGAQTGKTKTLFTGIHLMPRDLEEREAA